MNEPYLTPKELSERWGGLIKVKTLANWRSQGGGPRYRKIGSRIVYLLSAVEEFEATREFRTTGDYPEKVFS